MINCKTLNKWTDNRNTATNRSLKEEINTLLLSNSEKLSAMLCYKLLIRGTRTLSTFKCSFYKCISRLNAAHNLNDNIDFLIIHDNIYIMNQNLLYRISRKVSQVKHVLNLNLIACTTRYMTVILVDDFVYTRSNCSISEYRYIYHIFILLKIIYPYQLPSTPGTH